MLLIFTIVYLLASILYLCKYNIISSAILGAFVIFYICKNIKDKTLCTLKSLFTIGFIGGFSFSLLKLSNLSNEYSIKTLLVVFIAYFAFYIGYSIINKNKNSDISSKYCFYDSDSSIISKLILIIIIVSFLSFIIEAIKLRYIPILSIGTPHAYSEFHIFMLHYLTTSFVLIPSLSVLNIYKYKSNNITKNEFSISVFGLLYCIIMPIILVSRFQLIFCIFEFVMSYFVFYKKYNKDVHINDKKKIKYIIFALLLIVIIYIFITIARSHSVIYLNDIFNMKNKNIPIFITQPYIYITQNFENLNYMINNLPFYGYGRRMLAPLFSITLVKHFFPHITTAAPLIIKNELTTTTLIYDFYYDFSFFGVAIFSFLLGYLMNKLEIYVYSKRNNLLTMLIYVQMGFYMLFSFFQTFFSLSQTWIYIILSVFLYLLYIYMYGKRYKQ